MLGQCSDLTHLNLGDNSIGWSTESGNSTDGVESLAGVLGQCPALTHLDLQYISLGDAGTEILAGVLAQ